MWGQEVHKELAPQAPDFQPGNVFSAVPPSQGVFLPKGQVRLALITGQGMNEWLRVSPKAPPFQLFSTFPGTFQPGVLPRPALLHLPPAPASSDIASRGLPGRNGLSPRGSQSSALFPVAHMVT